MTLKQWKKRFYPRDAKLAAKDGEIAAVLHALNKWSGLTKENLAAFGLQWNYRMVYDPSTDERLQLDGATCALCKIHCSPKVEQDEGCPNCVLYKMIGERGCDDWNPFTHEPAPYRKALQSSDPTGMIVLLAKALEYLFLQQVE